MEAPLVQNVEKKEIEYKRSEMFLDLFIDPENKSAQLEEVKERVMKNDGVIRIFIPPLNLIGNKDFENQKFEIGGKVFPVSIKPALIMSRVVEHKNSPPVIVFENQKELDIARMVFESMWDDDSNAYPVCVVPTVDRNSIPIIPLIPEIKMDDGRVEEESKIDAYTAMFVFIKWLDSIGVKKVLVGGSELYINHDYVDGCVGNFIEFFNNYSNIETNVSAGTIPNGRDELRDAGFSDLL